MNNTNTPKNVNRDAIKASVLEMLDELTDCEAVDLEDFIVNLATTQVSLMRMGITQISFASS